MTAPSDVEKLIQADKYAEALARWMRCSMPNPRFRLRNLIYRHFLLFSRCCRMSLKLQLDGEAWLAVLADLSRALVPYRENPMQEAQHLRMFTR